ncbi:tol-pal system protein YbgF [Lysobacteraceae bacterium NML95-0200]|nr:tol-pal system protein YbgF [Xanthomonadaceae bacterium NML95-0200]
MKKTYSLLLASTVALPLLMPFTAEAQRRPSISDRVTALEQQANAPSPALELLRQIEEMRGEIRALRAQLEEVQHQNEQAANSARTRYLDVDARLQRLENLSQPTEVVVDENGNAVSQTAAEGGGETAVAPATPATPDERSNYEAALSALRAGQYADAARLFSVFLDKYPNGPYAPNAVYWLGESYYVTGNYALALDEFKALVQRWPRHDKAPGGLLKVGLSQIGLKQQAEGRRTLEAVAQQYPGTDAARTAQQRLRNLGN